MENISMETPGEWFQTETGSMFFYWRTYKCASPEAAENMKGHAVRVKDALLAADPSCPGVKYLVLQNELEVLFREKDWLPASAATLAEKLTCQEIDLFFSQLFALLEKLRQQHVNAYMLSFSNVFMRKGENGWEAALVDLASACIDEEMPEKWPEANEYTRKDIARWLADPKTGIPVEGADSYALACMFQDTMTLARKTAKKGRKISALDKLHAALCTRLKAMKNDAIGLAEAADLLKRCAVTGGCHIRVRIDGFRQDLDSMPAIILAAEDPVTHLSYSRWKLAKENAFTQFEEVYSFPVYMLSLSGDAENLVRFSFPRQVENTALEIRLEITKESGFQILSERLVSLTDPSLEAWIDPDEAGARAFRISPTGKDTEALPVCKAEEKKTEIFRVLDLDQPRNYIVRIEWLSHERCRLTMVNGRSFMIHASDASLYGIEEFIQERPQ